MRWFWYIPADNSSGKSGVNPLPNPYSSLTQAPDEKLRPVFSCSEKPYPAALDNPGKRRSVIAHCGFDNKELEKIHKYFTERLSPEKQLDFEQMRLSTLPLPPKSEEPYQASPLREAEFYRGEDLINALAVGYLHKHLASRGGLFADMVKSLPNHNICVSLRMGTVGGTTYTKSFVFEQEVKRLSGLSSFFAGRFFWENQRMLPRSGGRIVPSGSNGLSYAFVDQQDYVISLFRAALRKGVRHFNLDFSRSPYFFGEEEAP